MLSTIVYTHRSLCTSNNVQVMVVNQMHIKVYAHTCTLYIHS